MPNVCHVTLDGLPWCLAPVFDAEVKIDHAVKATRPRLKICCGHNERETADAMVALLRAHGFNAAAVDGGCPEYGWTGGDA